MHRVDSLKNAIEESNELAKQGDHQQALRLIDDLVAKAEDENRSLWVRVLSRHAATISDSMGDLKLAKYYCERVLAHSPEDSVGLYALADILFRQGEFDAAKQYAARSYGAATKRKHEEVGSLIELLIKRWPDLEQEKG
jgi:tetratricopeptide (TPR) repeat protein